MDIFATNLDSFDPISPPLYLGQLRSLLLEMNVTTIMQLLVILFIIFSKIRLFCEVIQLLHCDESLFNSMVLKRYARVPKVWRLIFSRFVQPFLRTEAHLYKHITL